MSSSGSGGCGFGPHGHCVFAKAGNGLDFLVAVAKRPRQDFDGAKVAGLGHAPERDAADAEKLGGVIVIQEQRSVAGKKRRGPALDQGGERGAPLRGLRAVGGCDGFEEAMPVEFMVFVSLSPSNTQAGGRISG